MSKWVPKWAKYYRIERPYPLDDSSVNIYFAASFTDGYKQLEHLRQELAILDVCQQIKDKPLHSRIDFVGQNGNDALVYKERPDLYNIEQKRSKYHREIKPGVWVDVYDVLNAFGVKCHALAHAIKKLLMPGERGAKGYKQDCEEAIQSVKRSIDEWG